MKIHPAAAELKWSPVQKECKVDDDADGGVNPDEDGAVDVAHVGDGCVDDAVEDVVGDGNEAHDDIGFIMINCNRRNCLIHTSSTTISNIKSTIIISINITMRILVNRWHDVSQHTQRALHIRMLIVCYLRAAALSILQK